MTGLRFLFPLALLAACSGGDAARTGSSSLDLVKRWLPRGAASGSAARDIAELDRAAIAGVKTPLIVALLERTRAAATLTPVGENGSHVTWITPDGISLTFDRGVLSATRGLGADLLSSETDPVLAALPGGGRYSRTLRHLDGENRVEALVLSCTLTDAGAETLTILERPAETRHAVETCSSPAGDAIRNDYWRGPDGTMWQSRQWISAPLGHVTVQRLVR